MLKKLLLGTALVASLAVAGQASALTYTSKIQHIDSNLSVDGDYGLVTIEELAGGKDLLITVDLNAPLTGIVDNGKAHIAFAFNLLDSPNSTISILDPVGGGSFTYLGESSFMQSPFGTFTNGFSCCGPSLSEAPPFVFKISNAAGITFAGVGATFDSNGRLTGTGTGNRLKSNDGGWWFAADTIDTQGDTGAKGARDAFVAVPEPGAWALMILGFGGAGAALRRRRAALAVA
ncbi:MAG: PEP-CTERM sorting domain-containing protein [Phenylobacterium sp.]|uniref:PEPxxWA-CTERM sorting domain-containing protein n=1 Tax=Phenylobacterium sp. TaxID=1871053 RepID=UPI00120F4534|nr:PEPxxWA-CTERM sorting domain-containing protein [Phenylobacterium sp.]TAJ72669.1 MAG: PEP-CTERM sorting domain-containing protein [Phenylobacterium sp.]